MLVVAEKHSQIMEWGHWLSDFVRTVSDHLNFDIAEANLLSARGLPGTDDDLLRACLRKVDDWALLVDRFTSHVFNEFLKNPGAFQNSEARFRVVAMVDCLQRRVGIQYNFAFAEGEYDASDSRNLFIHGILTGFGGTCVSMPV